MLWALTSDRIQMWATQADLLAASHIPPETAMSSLAGLASTSVPPDMPTCPWHANPSAAHHCLTTHTGRVILHTQRHRRSLVEVRPLVDKVRHDMAVAFRHCNAERGEAALICAIQVTACVLEHR